jgi:hypothetical protein
MKASPDEFPSNTAGLPEARSPELLELADGDQFHLRIAPVAKRLRDAVVRMLALQRLDSRPDASSAAGVGARGRRRERR